MVSRVTGYQCIKGTREKKQLIYVMVRLSYDAAKWPVSDFIGMGHLPSDLELTWADLKCMLIKEYADEGTAIETMKLTQARDETTKELAVRATKLSTIDFTEGVR